MNKEKILAMEAGRALDTLVAEKVMGHPMPDFIPEDALELYLSGSPIHYDGWTCVFRYDEGDIPKWVPDPYSTDISAAWQVVERMRSMEDGDGNSLLCCLGIYSDHDFVWDVTWSFSELSNRKDGHKKHRLPTSYYDLPEAICKAALLVKGGYH